MQFLLTVLEQESQANYNVLQTYWTPTWFEVVVDGTPTAATDMND